MKKPRYVDFPESEYGRRIRRAADLLKEEDLDALILTQSKNVYYITGIQHVDVLKDIKDMPPTVVILTRDQDAIIVGRWPRSHPVIQETCWPENVVSYRKNENSAEAIARALHEYGLSGGRVGMELNGGMRLGLSIKEFDMFKKQACESLNVDIVDGSVVVWRLRSIKSDFEIERLRRSAHAACKALEYAIENVEIGMNEIELARKTGQIMMEEGAFWYNTQVFYPPFGACVAFDTKILRGYVCFDFGAEYRHYVTDMHRVVLLGKKPTEEEKHLYNVRTEANNVIQRAVRPRRGFDEVLEELKAFVEESGCIIPEKYVGHGIGLDIHEPPSIGLSAKPRFYSGCGMPGYPTKFEVGMVFTLEPNIQHPKLPFSFNCEDDVVVTQTGCELLAKFPREMVIKS